MSANITSVYPKTSLSSFGKVLTAPVVAADAHTCISTNAVCIAVGGDNDSYVDSIRASHLGTNVETVIRIFLCNGTNNTAANNVLVASKKIPAYTINEIDQDVITEILPEGDVIAVRKGYRLYALTTVTLATGINVHATGGNY